MVCTPGSSLPLPCAASFVLRYVHCSGDLIYHSSHLLAWHSGRFGVVSLQMQVTRIIDSSRGMVYFERHIPSASPVSVRLFNWFLVSFKEPARIQECVLDDSEKARYWFRIHGLVRCRVLGLSKVGNSSWLRLEGMNLLIRQTWTSSDLKYVPHHATWFVVFAGRRR